MEKHVPAMKACPEPGADDPPHPSFFFNKLRVNQGYIFLRQGRQVKVSAFCAAARGFTGPLCDPERPATIALMIICDSRRQIIMLARQCGVEAQEGPLNGS